MKTKTQAIADFLKTQSCVVPLYSPEMETQVNVVPGKERAKLDNVKTIVWEDEENQWSAFRIPNKGAGIDAEPEYTDTILSWPFEKYVQAVGLTGWNWAKRVSQWVGFDFDSIVGHVKGLTDEELDKLRLLVKDVPWITLRRSKSSKGYHVYVELDPPVPTRNHTEHAALARAILSQLSALLDFDFNEKVDVAGGVLWIWHKDASFQKNSFATIKLGVPLKEPPPNWKDYLNAIRKRKRPLPDKLSDNEKEFNSLFSRVKHIELDEDHRRLLTWFANQNTTWWFDAEKHMLVCHTWDLKRAHNELQLKGIYDTLAVGKDVPHDQNCFCFPTRAGGWVVRRHGLKAKEHEYWITEPSGWTTCFYNKHPDFDSACRIQGGKRNKQGGYIFNRLTQAAGALYLLDVKIDMPDSIRHRQTKLLPGRREGEIVIEVKRELSDEALADWYEAKGPKWEQVIDVIVESEPVEAPDQVLRYGVWGGKEGTWFLHSRDEWVEKRREDIKDAMISLGYKPSEIPKLMGDAILNYWKLVKIPFEAEYPGNRQWNKEAPELITLPRKGEHPTWDIIIGHVSRNLQVENNEWCREHNIVDGAHYLKLWIASMFRFPFEPLPYLFFWGDQNCGKSIIHEGLQCLLKHGNGYARADQALLNAAGFNGELDGAILCVVEEANLKTNKTANERIKDWVTGLSIAIRDMRRKTYVIPNTTHWIQCANDPSYCPIFPGDTRISVSYVDMPKKEIPKRQLITMLQSEAGNFLNTIMNIEIPEPNSRLRIPVLKSEFKEDIASLNRTALQVFIEEHCQYAAGHVVVFNDFYQRFMNSIPPHEQLEWPRAKVGQYIPMGKFPKGRYGAGGQMHIGNIQVSGVNSKYLGSEIVRDDGKLKTKDG